MENTVSYFKRTSSHKSVHDIVNHYSEAFDGTDTGKIHAALFRILIDIELIIESIKNRSQSN